MKELHLPWNNWHSRLSGADYLTASPVAPNQWPVASRDAHFRDLQLAETFEIAVVNLIETSNGRRFERLVRREQDKLTVEDGRRVLRPLFETTEINLSSARPASRLHRLMPGPHLGPLGSISIPNSFFCPTLSWSLRA